MNVLLAELVETHAAVAATRSRLEKRALLAAALRSAGVDEAEIVASFLSGRPRQRRTGVGWRSLAELPEPAKAPSLTPTQVDGTLERLGALAGTGSQAARTRAVRELFSKATSAEQRFLRGLLLGELRQGALDSVLLDAIAAAAEVPASAVRRAAMFSALSGPIARAALTGGAEALEHFRLEVGRPVRPMLAASAPDVTAALERLGVAVGREESQKAGDAGARDDGEAPATDGADPRGGAGTNDAEAPATDDADPRGGAGTDDAGPRGGTADADGAEGAARNDGERPGRAVVADGKIDGIRVQVHRSGSEVTVFTRSLDDITDRVPEVVEVARSLGSDAVVLDGEAIALGPDGRPRPFQETGSRTMSRDGATLRDQVPLTVYFFDVLHLDGRDLIDSPAAERFQALSSLVPEGALVPRCLTSDPETVQEFFTEMIRHGHEGVVVKDLHAPYDAGRRGSAWVKVKPRHTLDLVVLAVEWGSGRREGTLSNIHLGARDGDDFVMLGKTFKGMTDEMLAWQTERFLELETGRSGHVVHVRPEQVVEIAFDGIQRSSRYPGGMALRFARVLRYRDDKTAAEADTVETVRSLA